MIKKIIKTVIFLVSISFVFLGCNKSDKLANYDGIFENPKEEIGLLHNEQLIFIFKNFESTPENISIKQYVENIINSDECFPLNYPISLKSIPDFPEKYYDLDLNKWMNEFQISSELKSEFSNTFELLQKAQSLAEILNGIKQKEISASKKFQGSDLDLYYEHLAVAKHTSIFWYPESEGGLNGIQYLKPAENLKPSQRVNWWKVLGVDCVGGMMGGPGGYAGASAISVIMQL